MIPAFRRKTSLGFACFQLVTISSLRLRHHRAELFKHRAGSRAAWTAGSNKAISTAMIAMTTSSSMSVKPLRLLNIDVTST
jgi:hypothetical protein